MFFLPAKVCYHLFGIKYFNFFSDGQSVATRLSKQVNHITKSVKKDIETYHNDDHGMVQQESLPLTINFDEIKDPYSSFWPTVRSTVERNCSNKSFNRGIVFRIRV